MRSLRGVGCHNEAVRVVRRAREALAEHAHRDSDCSRLARISRDVADAEDFFWDTLDDYRAWLSRMMDCLRAGILDPNWCWAFVDKHYPSRDARQCSLTSRSYWIPDTHIYQVCHVHAKSCPAVQLFRQLRELSWLQAEAELWAGRCSCGEEQAEEGVRAIYVYVMAQGDRRKVGMSVSPAERCNAIRLASGLETEVLWTEPHPDRAFAAKRESELHTRFADHRLQGEWFRSGPVDAWLEGS